MSRPIFVASALALLVACDDGDDPNAKKPSADDEPSSSEQAEPPADGEQEDEQDTAPSSEDVPDGVEEPDAAADAEDDAGKEDAQASALDARDHDASASDASGSSDALVDAASNDASSLMSNWGDQPCDKSSSKPGCKDTALALCICRGPAAEGGNAFCCNERWSYVCVDGALSVSACKYVSNKCCEAHPGDGCEAPTVEQCVCNEVQRMKRVESEAGRDPGSVHDCCREGWSAFCAILATTVCGASCG